MNFQSDNMSLTSMCEEFIKAKRNFNPNGHQKRYMFNVTSPFVDAEGLRFTAVTNSPYDYLDYVPTPEHVFLTEPTLEAFEKYVEIMFSDIDDWCYFKILPKLMPEEFENFTSIVRRGKYQQQSSSENYKVPICLIPIIELQTIEDYSRFYQVKAACLSLERTQIRLKINTYFKALMSLLNCNEDDIIEVLYQKGVLPSKDFQLISSQKELTIGLKRIRSSDDFLERFGSQMFKLESTLVLIKPKYGQPNTNLCQALQYLFSYHPLYQNHILSLKVQTKLNNEGKGRLPHAIPNNKRKYKQTTKDSTSLPKKMFKYDNISEEQDIIENIVIKKDSESSHQNSNDTANIEPMLQYEQSDENGTNQIKQQENEQESNVLCLVMKVALPEIYIPPGLIPVGYSWVDLNKLDLENDIEVEAEISTQ